MVGWFLGVGKVGTEVSEVVCTYMYCDNCDTEVGMTEVWMTEVWMTIVESGWNLWVWLVGIVSRRWVWLVGGIYGCG